MTLSFSTEAAVLAKSLTRLCGVVQNRNTVPILANVMIVAEGGKLVLTTTDMETSISETVPANDIKAGRATVGARLLAGIVRRLPKAAKVDVISSGDKITIRSDDFSADLVALDAGDFPLDVQAGPVRAFTMPVQGLRFLLNHTYHAISTEETRYYLNGIYLHCTDRDGIPVLRAVATDGHRLARADWPLPSEVAGLTGIIIPRAAVKILRAALKYASGDVGIEIADTRIRCTLGPITITAKLIDGASFPEYDRVIPRRNENLLTVDRDLLRDVIGRVSTVGWGKSRPVILSLSRDDVTISADSTEIGSARQKLNGKTRYGGSALDIRFQARYLQEAVAEMKGDVEFRFGRGWDDPATIVAIDDPAVLHLLMPMRV